MALISLEDQRQSFYQSRYNKRKNFEGELHIREADFQAFQTNGHVSHTCVGPKKIKWHRPHDPLIRPCIQVYIFVSDGNNKLCDATQEAQTLKAMSI